MTAVALRNSEVGFYQRHLLWDSQFFCSDRFFQSVLHLYSEKRVRPIDAFQRELQFLNVTALPLCLKLLVYLATAW